MSSFYWDFLGWDVRDQEQYESPGVPFALSIDPNMWARPFDAWDHFQGCDAATWPGGMGRKPPFIVDPKICVRVANELSYSGQIVLLHMSVLGDEVQEPTSLTLPDPSSQLFCVYDVADSFFSFSGVFNCGLSDTKLGRKGVPPYNSVLSPEDAIRMLPVCDRLVPEHAPFSVVRIIGVSHSG